MRFALRRIDSDGYWAVISSGIVFGTFLLESYNMSSFGGWDVLYRDDISWYTGLISMNCLLYTSPSPRDLSTSRMPSSA